MPAEKSLGKVNLLPLDSFEASFMGRGLKWALTAGRVLVVLTEFVVILAFASRFWFDKRLNDLVEVIDQKKQVVESYSEIEAQMRDILTRQSPIDRSLNRKTTPITVVEKLGEIVPSATTLTELTVDETKVSMAGASDSEAVLAQTLRSLKGFGDMKKINLEEVNFDQKLEKVVFKISSKLETYAK